MRLFLILAFFLIGCTDIEIQRGAELKQDKIDRITPESNKGDVVNLLGSPSATSTYGDETWYYIFNKRKQILTGEDEILEQNVLSVTFGTDDKVKNVEVFDESKAQNIEYSDKKTSTAGHELGVLEQILGNLGKFSGSDDARSTTRSGRTGGR